MSKLPAVILLSLSSLAISAAYAGTATFGDDSRDRREHHWAAPEIDPSSGITALTLLLGGLTVMRSRIGRK
jgi:hypothetical protein